MRDQYVALRLVEAPIKLETKNSCGFPFPCKMTLPDGCVGVLMVFKTKKSARKYYGKNVELQPIIKADG